MRDAAGAQHEQGVAGPEPALLDEGAPGGDRGAGQGGRLLVGEVGGHEHDPVLVQDDVVGEHAVEGTAEGGEQLGLVGRPPEIHLWAKLPATRSPDLHPRHAVADRHHLARPRRTAG